MVLRFFEALSRATCAYNCLHTCEGSGTKTKGATLPLSLAFVVLPAPAFLSTPSDFSSCVCVSASICSGLRCRVTDDRKVVRAPRKRSPPCRAARQHRRCPWGVSHPCLIFTNHFLNKRVIQTPRPETPQPFFHSSRRFRRH